MPAATEPKYLIVNRKARHEYHVLLVLEAGIALQGTEVKSLRAGKVNLTDSYASIEADGAWLHGANINVYTHGTHGNHDPLRDRRLLLNKNEIRKLSSRLKENGTTLIPLGLYLLNNRVKVELGLCKGKKSYDKRETIAKRDFQREQERKIKY